MKKITVNAQKKYDILISNGILEDSGRLIRSVSSAQKAAIITDSNVEKLYADSVKNSLLQEGFDVFVHTFPAGEENKKLETIYKMYEFLAENGFSRKDIVIALGGGVTGDMAGFAAATYMRGIAYVQIPTTLLAQVDSSVGGKTGCDLPLGKNLVGAFWQPDLVIIDPDTLRTLEQNFLNDGMAEVIKYGCIKNSIFFESIYKYNCIFETSEEIIHECVKIKSNIVENDEKEQGERMLLNFGHTIGHAIEKLNNFRGITHGEAVAIGMCMITKASEHMGLTENGTAEKIVKICERYNLPTSCNFSSELLHKTIALDKKSVGDSINLVFVSKIGDSFIKNLTYNELLNLLIIAQK